MLILRFSVYIKLESPFFIQVSECSSKTSVRVRVRDGVRVRVRVKIG
jgi:hypothetical protein